MSVPYGAVFTAPALGAFRESLPGVPMGMFVLG
jgi:hypothetical protein